MSQPWEALADSVLDTIKARARKAWDENTEAREFITERAKALAKLAWEYKTESDESKRAELHHEMMLVEQTVENGLTAMALIGSAETKSVFKEVVQSAVGVLVKLLPTLLAAI